SRRDRGRALRRHRDVDAAALDGHRVRAHPVLLAPDRAAGVDEELPAVPRAGDHGTAAVALEVRCDALVADEERPHEPFAERTELMRADVAYGVQPAVRADDPHLVGLDLDDPDRAFDEAVLAPDVDHATTPSVAACVAASSSSRQP